MSESLDVLRRWFEAFDRSDMDAARELFAADAVLHVTTPRELSGAYVGFDAFLEFYRRKREIAGERFTYHVDELLEGTERVAAVLTLSAGGSKPRDWMQIALYRITDGKIRELWFVEEEEPQRPSSESESDH